MTKTKSNQKSIEDYVYKDKVSKCEIYDNKTSLEMKAIISKLSFNIISKPSEQSKSLKELFSIIENKIHGKSIILRKSVLVSLCLVFKDILPTYKITVLTEQQKQQNMKNDTIKTYSEEEIMLGHYQKYIRILESVIKRHYNIESLNHIRWTESDELTLLKCASKLFLNNPSFNCSGSLLKLIIPNLNSTNPKFLKCASKTIEMAIKEDMKLEVAQKICEGIKKYAVDNKFNIRSTVIKLFEAMELEDVSLDETDSKKSNKKTIMSRKQKKDLKKNKHYIKQMEQINAKESLSLKTKNNSQIIRDIFYIYFRILKRNHVSGKLLETVLEGVEKFGRLVDCKLFPDIFSLMMKIVQNSKVSMENRLRSVFVCLNIVTSGKASDILDIDPGKFSNKLVELASKPNLSETSVILAINCCTKVLVKRRKNVAQNDVQTIIKMLIKMAWDHKNVTQICGTVLVSLVRYLRLYPQLQYLFEDGEEEETLSDDESKKGPQDSLGYIQDLCKMSIYEIGGVAKGIKKFFVNNESSLVELKGSLEELTRMKAEECLAHLKERFQKPPKRQVTDNDDENDGKTQNKKAKVVFDEAQ